MPNSSTTVNPSILEIRKSEWTNYFDPYFERNSEKNSSEILHILVTKYHYPSHTDIASLFCCTHLPCIQSIQRMVPPFKYAQLN